MASSARVIPAKRRAIDSVAAPLTALALYTALAFLLFQQTWRDPTHLAPGLGGDSSDFVWFLQWSAFAVTHHHNPLITTYINFPAGVNLMWNTTMTLPGIVLTPVTVTAGPIVAYALLITLSPVVSAMCAMVAFRRFARSTLAAAVGGLIYGFSPPIVIQSLGHPQVTLAFFPPLALIALDELIIRQERSPIVVGALFGALSAVQIVTGEEILASTALVGAIGLTILLVLQGEQIWSHARHAVVGLAAAAGTAAVLGAYPLWIQFFGPQRIHGDIHPRNVFVSDLLNFVVPTGFQAIAPAGLQSIVARFTGNGSEFNGYLGIPLITLLIIASWRLWRVPVVRWAIPTSFAVAVLSLGPHLHIGGHDTGIRLPGVVLGHLPVLSNVLPNRLALYVILLGALVVAVTLDHMLRFESKRWRFGGATVVLAALTPLVPVFPFPAVAVDTPAFFTGSAIHRIHQDAVVLVAPYAHYPESAAPMLWQAVTGMRYRMPEGYFAGPGADGTAQFGPPASPLSMTMEEVGFNGDRPQLTSTLRASLQADFLDHRVSTVVVGPMPHESLMVETFTDLFGRPPEQIEGVYVWWDLPTTSARGASDHASRPPFIAD